MRSTPCCLRSSLSALWVLVLLCAALQSACKTNFPAIADAPQARSDEREKALPDALDELLEEGERAERNGDAAGAGEAYRSARERFPEYALAWSYYGEYLRFYGADPEAAARAFRRAVAAPRTDRRAAAFAWRGLAEIAQHQGSADEALRLLYKSIDLMPLAAAHRSLSALLATAYRDFAGAAEHASLALQLEPEDPLALLQYAVQLVRLGKPVEGRSAFVRALELGGCDERGRAAKPVHCCILYNAACYYAVSGADELALVMLQAFFKTPEHRHISREALEADPDLEGLGRDPRFLELIDRFL
mgnify:CR=1 FL=1